MHWNMGGGLYHQSDSVGIDQGYGHFDVLSNDDGLIQCALQDQRHISFLVSQSGGENELTSMEGSQRLDSRSPVGKEPFEHFDNFNSRNRLVRTRVIVQQALSLLRPMYREGFDYAKAGVMLGELVDESGVQEDLFQAAQEQAPGNGRSERLMAVMDTINRKSRATVYMARAAGPAAYAMRRGHLSPAYTTCWEELPKV